MSSFIGCKISLVSKAQIRYEGILYTIDPRESTVALSRVKSFGTEDRKVDRVIPARDEIYEYIIFRGSDIEDLNVCERSKEYYLQMEDSAILSAETSIPGSMSNKGASPKGLNQGDNHGTVTPKTGREPHTQGTDKTLSNGTKVTQSKEETSFKQKVSASHTGRQSGEHRKVPCTIKKIEAYNNGFSDSKQDRGKTSRQDRSQKGADKYGGNYNYNYNYEFNYDPSYGYHGSNYQNNVDLVLMTKDYDSYNGRAYRRYDRKDYRHDQYYGNETNKLRGFESSEYNRDYSQGSYYGGKSHKQTQEKYTYETFNSKTNRRNNASENTKQKEAAFKEDYDFETANAIIAKELANMHLSQEKKESNEDDKGVKDDDICAESDVAYYDKTKSFFDMISSEMLDRANGKVVRPLNRKDERKMNVETFGVAEASRNGSKRSGSRGGGRLSNKGSRGHGYVEATYRNNGARDKKEGTHKSSAKGVYIDVRRGATGGSGGSGR